MGWLSAISSGALLRLMDFTNFSLVRLEGADPMTDILGFPIDMALTMLLLGMAYFFAVHSPVCFALFAVWRQRKTMRRRILFVGTVMGATYGFLVLFVLGVCIPAFAFSIWVVPALKEQGYLRDSIFLLLVQFVFNWWWALLPFAVLIPGFFISRYFAKRWNAIADALNS